jgi:signal transduction histidine kinase
MRRLRIRFLMLAAALLVPVGLLIERSLESIEFERAARHDAVAERVFNELERALSDWLEEEEAHPFGHYRFYYSPVETVGGTAAVTRSPLASLPQREFIIGYFQIDPDGTLHTPHRPRDPELAEQTGDWRSSPELLRIADQLERWVGPHWQRASLDEPVESPFDEHRQDAGTTFSLDRQRPLQPEKWPSSAPQADSETGSFAALRELNRAAEERPARKRKVEMARSFDYRPDAAEPPAGEAEAREAEEGSEVDLLDRYGTAASSDGGRGIRGERAPALQTKSRIPSTRRVRVELEPMTSRVLDAEHLLLYRTVLQGSQGYRQGALVDTRKLASWLRAQTLGSTELARQARLQIFDRFSSSPPDDPAMLFAYRHRFAEPFSELGARLELPDLPGLGGASYVYTLSVLLLVVGVLGLFALYRMVAVVLRFAERRSNFAAAVSHELKTPLTAIRMYAEMLRDGMVDSEAKRREYYRAMTTESERLSRLINNVLEFSRLEKGTRELSSVVGPIDQVVQEASDLLRAQLESEGFGLEIQIDDDLPAVRFDRDALLQVLFNLVDNALKYARDAQDRRVQLHCTRDGQGVRLSVRDFGPGVQPRQLGSVFEPFYRGEDELTRKTKGTGIGLALVRSLVEQMGGSAVARNVQSGGFMVCISLHGAR